MAGNRHDLSAYSVYPYLKDPKEYVYVRAREFFYAFKNGRSYRLTALSFEDVVKAIVHASRRCPAFARPAVLVPVPRSGSSRASFDRDACKHPSLALAQQFAQTMKSLAVHELIGRGTPVPRASDTPDRVSVDQHRQSLTIAWRPELASARLVLIDDIVTKGTQLIASMLALRHAGYQGAIEAFCVSQTVAPDPSPTQLLPYLVHRIRWREGNALASRDDLQQWREGDLRP
jgi:predicted amidophosphoribosyltransferase